MVSDDCKKNPVSEINPYQTPLETESAVIPPGAINYAELKTTRVGLYLTYYGIVAMMLFGILAPIMAIAGASFGQPFVVGLLMMAVGGGMILAAFGTFAGQVCCVTVPEASGAKSMSLATIALQVAGFLTTMGAGIWVGVSAAQGNMPAPNAMGVHTVIQILGTVIGMASFGTFVVFLKRLNEYIGEETHASKASGILRWVVGLMIAYTVITLVSAALTQAATINNAGIGPQGISIIATVIVMILMMIVFIQYANLIIYTAKSIGEKSAGN